MSDSGDVKGSFDGRFKALRDILAANLESGEDLGASVAVTVEGHPVVDLWGGWSDEGRQSRGARTRSPMCGRRPRP